MTKLLSVMSQNGFRDASRAAMVVWILVEITFEGGERGDKRTLLFAVLKLRLIDINR